MEKKFEGLKAKLETLDEYIEENKRETKNEKDSVIRLAVVYDASAAVSWAYNNVYSTLDYGADCTNFVSKAINKGGIPTDGTWYQDSNAAFVLSNEGTGL